MKKLILFGLAVVLNISIFSQKNTIWASTRNISELQSSPNFLNISKQLGIKIKQAFPSSHQETLKNVFEFSCNCDEIDLYASLHKIPGITGIEYGPKYETLSTIELIPNDYPIYGFDYALDIINALDAWNITTGDPSISIAITDANYYIYHEELAGKIDYISDNYSTDYTHGTAVAITAAGNTNNGVGKSSIGYNSHLQLRIMDYNEILEATYSGAKVINMSWSSGCYYNSYAQLVIDEAYNNGSVLIAAAGNGSTCDGASNLVYPASYEHVISVSSIGNNKNHEKNIGDPSSTHQHNNKVDLVAPGYSVLLSSSPGNYGTGNGTSFAAPYVSGTVALMLSVNKCLTPSQIEYILKTTSDSTIYNVNPNYIGLLGSGLLNAFKAVEMAKTFNTFEAQLISEINCSIDTRQAKVLNINGELPLTVKWSTGVIGEKIDIDTTMLYEIEVTDNAGCKFYTKEILEKYKPMTIQSNINHIKCNGINDGSIFVETHEGQSPYNYFWNNGDTTSSTTNLHPGQYIMNVIDAEGCSKMETFIITQPDVLTTELLYDQPTETKLGSIDLNVKGGFKPYQYQWNHGETSEDLNNVVADFYEVLVTDANGCMTSENIVLTNQVASIDEKNDENLFSIFPNPTEGNATIRIFSYQYNTLTIQNINGQQIEANIQNNMVNLTDLAAGLYLVKLETTNGQATTKTLIVI